MVPQDIEQGRQSWIRFRLRKPIRWLREVLAIIMWGLAVIQVFLFDAGTLITDLIPMIEPVFRYRFLVGLGLLAVLWLILRTRVFLNFFGYIILYPFVVVLWKIPKFAFRNWAVAIAFSPAIHTILTTFRISFAMFTAALIASFVVCLVEEVMVVRFSMLIVGAYLILHYIRRFRVAFSPSTVFADVAGAVRTSWTTIRESKWAVPPEGDPASEQYQQQFGQSLLQIYMTTAGLYFIAARLKEVIESHKLDLYFLGSLVFTFTLTTVVFAVEYFGLERLRPGSFVGVPSPGLLDFLGYSFSTLMTSELSPLHPNSQIALILSYFQLLGSLLIIVLLVFVVLTSIRERYRQDLGGVVEEVGEAAGRVTALIEANYKLTLASAEAWLLEHQRPITRWLLRIRYGEENAKGIPGYSDPPLKQESKSDSAGPATDNDN